MSTYPNIIAAKDARITELEAEVERLKQERDYWQSQHDERTRQLGQSDAEALSRTGAGKVKELIAELEQMTESERDHLREVASDEIKALLVALESAQPAPEAEPVAWLIHAPEDDYYGTGPDSLQFHPLAQRDLDNGYRQTPLYERPAEQAVTEAMVEAAVQAVRQYTRDTLFIDEHRELVRAALKAAMEAGG